MDIKTDFTERIRISPAKLKLIKKFKDDKTAAKYLDEILDEHFKPNLFKK